MKPFTLQPEYKEYVWGGKKIRPEAERTAEAWIVYEKNILADGEDKGLTLDEAAAKHGEALLGSRVVKKTGLRFPLLIKILDCAGWLSLQVHPDDEQAVAIEGKGYFGKTEGWFFIETDADAEILGGVKPGVSQAALEEAIRSGKIMDVIQRLKVNEGESVLMLPGTIHALGPGMLLYEVQQSSDLTYRVYDWDRPASDGRPLHIEKSVAVSRSDRHGTVIPAFPLADGDARRVLESDYFKLDHFQAEVKSLALDTHGESFAAVTVLEGMATVSVQDWQSSLSRFDTVIVPAACGAYQITPQGKMHGLVATA